MSGSFLSLLSPATPLGLLHVLYGYVLPITIVCVWTATAVLDLASSRRTGGATLAWSALVLGVPVVGSVGYLLFSRKSLSSRVALGLVVGGFAIVGASYGLSYALIG